MALAAAEIQNGFCITEPRRSKQLAPLPFVVQNQALPFPSSGCENVDALDGVGESDKINLSDSVKMIIYDYSPTRGRKEQGEKRG
jgi:hypothetical protein